MSKTFITHIPYRGAGPALVDLMAGQVDIMFDGLGSSAQHIRSGKIKAIAVASNKRNPAFPNIPTASEAGLPGYEVSSWYALWAPKGTPQPIIDKMKVETWMGSKLALADGFIDEIYDPTADKKAKAEFDTEGKGMSIFARLFPDNADAVAKLDAMLDENATLHADLENAQARINDLAPLAEANATLQSELATAQASITAATVQATADAEKITALEAAAEVTAEKVSLRAAELLATQGHPAPVSLAGDSGSTEAKTKTRAEFNALDHIERGTFLKSGGKLTN